MSEKELGLCQCARCERYLARNRDSNGHAPQMCVECYAILNENVQKLGGPPCAETGIPLARIRAACTDPLSVELLGFMTEECGEVNQRIGKILRWGWEADFEGTTQQHKFEVELGDVLTGILLLLHNKLIRHGDLMNAVRSKLTKLTEDACGPRQRLQVAEVPTAAVVQLGTTSEVLHANLDRTVRELFGLD